MSEIKSPRRAVRVPGRKSPEAMGLFICFGWLSQKLDVFRRPVTMDHLWRLWHEDEGQDIAEYAVMLAVILVIVVGTIRLIGSNANNVFSNVASSIQ
jgi:Flp pilus assembly pilin Flp